MPKAIDAYHEGYEQGRHDGIAGNITQAVMGILRDDPDGHFAIGYRDGAAGREFKPPTDASAYRRHEERSWSQLIVAGFSWIIFLPVHVFISMSRQRLSRAQKGWYLALLGGWLALAITGIHQVSQTSHRGTATIRTGGLTQPSDTNDQSVYNSNEQPCKDRDAHWTRDNIYLTNAGAGVLIVSSSPDYIVRPGDLITLCVEALDREDLHDFWIEVGNWRPGEDRIVWEVDSSANRVWYTQKRIGSFLPEVNGQGGYLHFNTKNLLRNPVRIFLRFR